MLSDYLTLHAHYRRTIDTSGTEDIETWAPLPDGIQGRPGKPSEKLHQGPEGTRTVGTLAFIAAPGSDIRPETDALLVFGQSWRVVSVRPANTPSGESHQQVQLEAMQQELP